MMSDEKIDVGEQVVTSGGDRIYPKGLPVGTVSQVSPDKDNEPFLAVKVKPAADINRLEEVLVVTKIAQDGPDKNAEAGDVRAADILAERLPSIPKPDEAKKPKTTAPANAPGQRSNPAQKTGASGPAAPPHPDAAHSMKSTAVNAQQQQATKAASNGNAAAGNPHAASASGQGTTKASQPGQKLSASATGSAAEKKTDASPTKAASASTPHSPGPKPSASPEAGASPRAAAPTTGDSGQTKPADAGRPPR
jgi:rod shape-determining protein MreC